MRNWRKRIWNFFIVCIVGFLCVSTRAFANEQIDFSQMCSVKVNALASDIVFRIYHIANMDSNLQFLLSDQFSNYPIDLSRTDAEEWQDTAQIIDAYIKRDKIEPCQVQITDEDGVVRFEGLRVGLYLVVGENFEWDGGKYVVSPALLSVPSRSGEEWSYAIEMYAKARELREGQGNYHVVKAWEDNGKEKNRPLYIEIQLLKDNEVYQEIILNSENNWRYTFKNLSNEHVWTVVEKESYEDYFVRLKKDDNNMILINTFVDYPDEPESSNDKEESDLLEKPEELPQTGQMWWPIPILLIAGFICIIHEIGTLRKRKRTLGVTGGVFLMVAALLLVSRNFMENKNADEMSQEALDILQTKIMMNEEVDTPIFESYPELEMAEREIDGEKYIGILDIPSQNLALPVISEWSNERLKKAICRYEGSIYDDSMIIAGHNYPSHFSKIKKLAQGDSIIFSDVDGNVFLYKVCDFEKIEETNIEGMKRGEWDLTLFTCDYRGDNRIAIRCMKE